MITLSSVGVPLLGPAAGAALCEGAGAAGDAGCPDGPHAAAPSAMTVLMTSKSRTRDGLPGRTLGNGDMLSLLARLGTGPCVAAATRRGRARTATALRGPERT